MKFMCIAYEEQRKLDELSQSDWQALREETLDYVARLRQGGRLITAHPLKSAKIASTVRVRNGKTSVTDGPFAETKEQIGGFFLVEASNIDEAIQIAAQWPSARIGTIEVRPVDDELRTDRRYEAS
jgi:hypothetical protein